MLAKGSNEESFTLEPHPDKESWLAAHKTAIGGSSAAAVMNENAWNSPFTLWSEMSGHLELGGEESEAMSWGTLLEPVVAAEWARRTERSVIDHGRYTIARSKEHPFMIATLDREITSVTDGPGALEIKTTNAFNDREWDEEPPTQYQIQVQHQLLVTGWSWGILACLIGGQKLKWWKVKRDDAYLAAHLKECQDFMRRIREQDPPPVDGNPRTSEALRRLYTEDPALTIVLDQEAVSADASITKLSERIDKLETEKERLRNIMRQKLGEAVVGMLPGGGRWNFKQTKSGVRVLRKSGR